MDRARTEFMEFREAYREVPIPGARRPTPSVADFSLGDIARAM
jgi:hypothetical protein